jgi:hypothetical protein
MSLPASSIEGSIWAVIPKLHNRCWIVPPSGNIDHSIVANVYPAQKVNDLIGAKFNELKQQSQLQINHLGVLINQLQSQINHSGVLINQSEVLINQLGSRITALERDCIPRAEVEQKFKEFDQKLISMVSAMENTLRTDHMKRTVKDTEDFKTELKKDEQKKEAELITKIYIDHIQPEIERLEKEINEIRSST